MDSPHSIIPLGRNTIYKDSYDKSLLFFIKRKEGRATLNLTSTIPFKGYDIWNCYELSWLNEKKKPEIAILRLFVPAESEYIFESKSLKLYLNSFNNTIFQDKNEVRQTIMQDIKERLQVEITAEIYDPKQFDGDKLSSFSGSCLDELDVAVSDFTQNPNILQRANQEIIEETVYSNLLRSNCLITNQPDWASVQINYLGPKIEHNSLLLYLISFRNHNEFHEHCVERIFMDIYNLFSPQRLTVYAKYTRRGGIDINPIRSTDDLITTEINILRDIRQ